MTRINIGIAVRELPDQWVSAEIRELRPAWMKPLPEKVLLFR